MTSRASIGGVDIEPDDLFSYAQKATWEREEMRQRLEASEREVQRLTAICKEADHWGTLAIIEIARTINDRCNEAGFANYPGWHEDFEQLDDALKGIK